VEDPNEFVLVEAFKDDAAGDHVNSTHFQKAMAGMPQALAETPRIISRQLDGDSWDRMGELTIG
jgi:quinol monooxygenase YgiN